MENSIKKTGEKRAFNLSAKHSLMILIVGIFLLPKIASASPVLPERLIELTNAERQRNNLSTLTYNSQLAQAAEEKAKAILSSGRFEHNIDGRRFSAWIKDAGYEYSYVGENLAIDFETSEGIFEAWKDSETHYRNIINDHFQEIGIAVVEGDFKGQKTIVVAQVFGSPLTAVPQPQVMGEQSKNITSKIKDKISNTYYILSAGTKSITAEAVETYSQIKSRIQEKSNDHLLAIESFRLASMLFFTISLMLFYAYSTMHIFVFMPARRLD